jgi:hypothetical protein
LNLLPLPRSIKQFPGNYSLAKRSVLLVPQSANADDARGSTLKKAALRLCEAAADVGVKLDLVNPRRWRGNATIEVIQSTDAPAQPEGYRLEIGAAGLRIHYRQEAGFRAAVASLRQLLREYGRRLPLLTIVDYPDFPRRGVMLDVSRGRVPKLATLMELVEHLADFKINEFQLYMEHTFAYRKHKAVWNDWGALTGKEIHKLDTRCKELGIDLVPNQNSFGHLRYWLEHEPYRKLAETSEPYEDGGGAFLRYPSTLAPNHAGTLPFLRGLYDELLPNFSSRRFNVGCDETWDLGRGQSRGLCERKGKGRVYLDFLKRIHGEVAARGRQMMFWGDIVLNHSELIGELPKEVIALNWGYESDHPFEREARSFARAGVRFYVCPGTSTWMTMVGRYDNALANLRAAAKAGKQHGAEGYLITDWGDGGHPQPLAVSYHCYAAGAALSWCAQSFDEELLVPVLSRDVFKDATEQIASTAFGLGLAHRKFKFKVPNLTPFGAVIAAPPPRLRELVCRDGLKYYQKIHSKNIQAALGEVEKQHRRLKSIRPTTASSKVLRLELDFAARMAVVSCKYMLWQQARTAHRMSEQDALKKELLRELEALERDFRRHWPRRNKGPVEKCAAFLNWRQRELRGGHS